MTRKIDESFQISTAYALIKIVLSFCRYKILKNKLWRQLMKSCMLSLAIFVGLCLAISFLMGFVSPWVVIPAATFVFLDIKCNQSGSTQYAIWRAVTVLVICPIFLSLYIMERLDGRRSLLGD